MHHVIVTRVFVSLCLLLAGCILGFALLADHERSTDRTSPGGPPAEMLFRTYCGGCHDAGELAAALRAAPDRDARMAEWRVFLESHGRAGPEQDRAILEFLDKHQ